MINLYIPIDHIVFLSSGNRCDSILHAETHATTVLLSIGGGFALHLLADLDVDIEELGDTAVQADGFALVEIAFAVVGGNALLGAGLGEASEHVRDHLDFGLGSSELLLGRHLGLTTEKERHCEYVKSVEC